jgi:hypothetical protein
LVRAAEGGPQAEKPRSAQRRNSRVASAAPAAARAHPIRVGGVGGRRADDTVCYAERAHRWCAERPHGDRSIRRAHWLQHPPWWPSTDQRFGATRAVMPVGEAGAHSEALPVRFRQFNACGSLLPADSCLFGSASRRSQGWPKATLGTGRGLDAGGGRPMMAGGAGGGRGLGHGSLRGGRRSASAGAAGAQPYLGPRDRCGLGDMMIDGVVTLECGRAGL